MSPLVPGTTSEYRANVVRTVWLVCSLVAARAIFLVLPDPSWWGINHLQYLEPVFAGLLIVATIIGVAWGILPSVKQESETASSPRPWWHTAAFVSACGVMFWFLAPPYTFLGDSSMFSGELWRVQTLGQHVSLHKEPIPMLLAEGVFWMQNALNFSPVVHTTYLITAALCGMAFVWIAIRLAYALFPQRINRYFTLALLLSCGGTLLFFGYMETYAVAYVFTLAYFMIGLNFLRGRSSLAAVVGLLVLCILAHFQHILLIPSLFALLLLKKKSEGGARLMYRTLLVVLPLLLIIYIVISFSPTLQSFVGKTFIPLHSTAGSHYTLFSFRHVFDIFNEHLLLAAVPLLLIVAFQIFFRARLNWLAPDVVFIVTAIAFMEAFLIGGFLDLGIARDWDVASALGPAFALLALVLFKQITAAGVPTRPMAIVASSVALAGMVAWIVLNMSMNTSVRRFTDLIESYRPLLSPAVTRFGYEDLRKYYAGTNDIRQELKIDKTMLETLPWHFDAIRAISFMEQHSKALGSEGAKELQDIVVVIASLPDSSLVLEDAGDEGNIRLGPHGSGDFITLGDAFELGCMQLWQHYNFISIDQVIARADTFIMHHPRLPNGFELKGRAYFFKDEYDSSGVYLDRAIAEDPSRARPYFFRSHIAFRRNAFDSARTDIQRCLDCDSLYYAALSALSIMIEQHPRGLADSADISSTIRRLQLFIKTAPARYLSAEIISGARESLATVQRVQAAMNERESVSQ